MQDNPINCLFISIIVVFIIAFLLVCFSVFLVLSSAMEELDAIFRENHDSAGR